MVAWFVGGDWNFVLDLSDRRDKYGRNPAEGDKDKADFEALSEDWDLVEIAGVRGEATPTHFIENGNYATRLDRWYCTQESFAWITESKTTPTVAYSFDHHLVTLEIEPPLEEEPMAKAERPMLVEVIQTYAYGEALQRVIDIKLPSGEGRHRRGRKPPSSTC